MLLKILLYSIRLKMLYEPLQLYSMVFLLTTTLRNLIKSITPVIAKSFYYKTNLRTYVVIFNVGNYT